MNKLLKEKLSDYFKNQQYTKAWSKDLRIDINDIAELRAYSLQDQIYHTIINVKKN